MGVYRTKRAIVEAMRWEPGDPAKAGEVVGWLMANGVDFHHPTGRGGTTTLAMRAAGEPVLVQPRDWIVKRGDEFYRCKPDTFEATYDPACRT